MSGSPDGKKNPLLFCGLPGPDLMPRATASLRRASPPMFLGKPKGTSERLVHEVPN
jgi:hypothetical protein